MSVRNILSQIFSKLNIPRSQSICSNHERNNQFICCGCYKGLYCKECLVEHQCLLKDSQQNYQHYSKFYAKNKENCIKLISNAKIALSQKLSTSSHHSILLHKNGQKIGLNEFNKLIIMQIAKAQQQYKKSLEQQFTQMQHNINTLYFNFESQAQQHLNSINPDKCQDRIRFLQCIELAYQKFVNLSNEFVQSFISHYQGNYESQLYHAINTALSQIFPMQNNRKVDQNNISMKQQKKIRNNKVISQVINIQTQLKTQKSLIETSTQFQPPINKVGVHSNQSIDEEKQQSLSRIVSLEKIICSDLEVISASEKKIKDLQFYIQKQRKKNNELTNKYHDIKTKYQQEKLKFITFEENIKKQEQERQKKGKEVLAHFTETFQNQRNTMPVITSKLNTPNSKVGKKQFDFDEPKKTFNLEIETSESKKNNNYQQSKVLIRRSKLDEKLKKTKK